MKFDPNQPIVAADDTPVMMEEGEGESKNMRPMLLRDLISLALAMPAKEGEARTALERLRRQAMSVNAYRAKKVLALSSDDVVFILKAAQDAGARFHDLWYYRLVEMLDPGQLKTLLVSESAETEKD